MIESGVASAGKKILGQDYTEARIGGAVMRFEGSAHHHKAKSQQVYVLLSRRELKYNWCERCRIGGAHEAERSRFMINHLNSKNFLAQELVQKQF